MAKSSHSETDTSYFLKILLYFVLGTVWVRIAGRTVLPIGFLAGLMLARGERFQIDRKIEYAILLVATLLGLIGFGVFLSF